jgi:hypothetical protein
LYLEQGSAPTLTTQDNWYAVNDANATLNEYLQTPGSWPWQPGYSYLLAVTNTSAVTQPFVIVLNGEGPGSPFGFTSVSPGPGGTYKLNMFLIPGQSYQLQSSTNLINWTPLSNISPSVITNVQTINPIGVPDQFFRILEQ